MVGLQRAKELALTGRIVEAAEAVAIGLALEMIDHDALATRVDEIVEALVAGGPVAQMFIKQGINSSFEMSFPQSLAEEGQSQSICLTSGDAQEGVAAFVEKRLPAFRGR
jgi:2-(1,2-epoxy-1,2-dihydrophenyl)acetyl-CoA isomerase